MAGSQQSMTAKVRGLYTNPSQYGQNVPQGASNVCDNICLDRESFAQTRRGFHRYGTSLGVGAAVTEIMQYGNDMLIHMDDGRLLYDSDQQGTWAEYQGRYSSPSTDPGSRIRSAESNKNFFFTTSAGAYKLDQIGGIPQKAGLPQAMGGSAVLVPTSGGWMANNTNVAYRVVWGYTDNNNNLILSAPSGRIVVSNTTGTACTVSLTINIPRGLSTNCFFQLYRSVASVDQNTEPNDELQQCAEFSSVLSFFITTRTPVTVADKTPDTLLQASLYTNPSQQGIAQANNVPPFATDMAVYKGYTFYANTRQPHRLFLTMAAGSLLGIEPIGWSPGDSLTFTNNTTGASFTLQGVPAPIGENISLGHFGISVTGDPAIDIQATSQSLIRILNAYSANTWLNGYYLSDYGGLPGQLMFEKADLTPETFYIKLSSQPINYTLLFTVDVTPGQNNPNNVSQNDAQSNRLHYSKYLQPEAVPLLNYLDVGSAKHPIRRIIPLRDGLIILKDDGVFRLYGLSAPFTLAPLDNTVNLLADNTAVLLNNYVYFLSTQGVVMTSDSATQIVSRPIETDILKLTALDNYPNFADIAFAVPYESDRKYILGLQVSDTDQTCPQQYTYNYITNDWTRWTRSMNCGMVNKRDNKLYYGGPQDLTYGTHVFVERKSYTVDDFADEDFTINIVSAVNDVITVDSTAPVAVGNTLFQSADVTAVVTNVVNSTTLIVDNILVWATGPTTVYTQIDDVLETIQLDCSNPGIMKHFKSISFIFSDSQFDELDVTYTSDSTQASITQKLANDSGAAWGQFDWGDEPWGSVLGGKKRIETRVPSVIQRADWITANIKCGKAFSSFGLSEISLVYTTMTERKGKAG